MVTGKTKATRSPSHLAAPIACCKDERAGTDLFGTVTVALSTPSCHGVSGSSGGGS